MIRFRLLALTVVVATLAIFATGCDSIQNAIYKSAIEKAIHEDSLTGHESSYDHTNAMRKVDLSNCPPEFREAYSKHIHAWEESAAVKQARAKLDTEADAAAVGGMLASIFGSDETPWSDHLQAIQELNRLDGIASGDIHTTWQSVEDVARKYGAQI